MQVVRTSARITIDLPSKSTCNTLIWFAACIVLCHSIVAAQEVESWLPTDRDGNDLDFSETIKQQDSLRTKFLECFPVAARELLDTSTSEPYTDEEIQLRAQHLRASFESTADMVVAIFKAFGVRARESWTLLDESDLVLFQALRDVDIEQLLSALARIKNDQIVLHGASRFFLDPHSDILQQLNRTEWRAWVPKLAKRELDLGSDINFNHMIGAIADRELPAATKLLREIAYDERIVEAASSGNKVSPRIFALMMLASRNDQCIKSTVDKLLADTTRELDVAALEICLALLGDPKLLSKSHFELHSRQIELAAFQAIEKYSGQYGMDILIYSALTRPSVREEAAIFLQRISGQRWLPNETVQHRKEYASDAAAWWRANPQAFAQSYVAKDD